MSNYQSYLQSKGFTSRTIKGYYNDLLRFINWCEDERIEVEKTTHNQLIQYIDSLRQKNITQQSIQRHLLAIKYYFDWLSTTHEINYNPALSLKIRVPHEKKLYKLLDRQQLDAIYHHYPIPEQDTTTKNIANAKRNKIIVGLMVFQGLDAKDIALLEEKDLLLREGKLDVPSTRKSDKRTIELKAPQIMELMEYTSQIRAKLLGRRSSDKLIVSSRNSEKLHSTFKVIIAQLKQSCPELNSLKQIRASVIVGWIRQEGLRKAQYLAGHRYISSTEAYQQNDITDLQLDIDRVHPLN